ARGDPTVPEPMRTPQLLLISNLANSTCSSVGAMTSGAPVVVVSPQFAPNVTGVAVALMHFSLQPGIPARFMAAGVRLEVGATASSLHATAANVTAAIPNPTIRRDILERLLSDVMTNSVSTGWLSDRTRFGVAPGGRRQDERRGPGQAAEGQRPAHFNQSRNSR